MVKIYFLHLSDLRFEEVPPCDMNYCFTFAGYILNRIVVYFIAPGWVIALSR
jgi:hypothetical protein